LITISQSVLSTNYVQVPVTIQSPASYDPSGDDVAFAFTPYTYPTTAPSSGDWHAGSWLTFAGPSYWAQVLVGPAGSGVSLAIGKYSGWIRVTDSPAVPVEQAFLLQITP
jgi:hypothetical protein